jgi:hypothetical protein
LYWSAVINGVVAVPVMTVMMLMTARPASWGNLSSPGGCGGWAGLRQLRWVHVLLG